MRDFRFCKSIALLLSLVTICQAASAQEKIVLWPDGAPGAMGNEEHDQPSLTAHLPPADRATGTAIVICPGGGYGHLAVGHEGEDIGKMVELDRRRRICAPLSTGAAIPTSLTDAGRPTGASDGSQSGCRMEVGPHPHRRAWFFRRWAPGLDGRDPF